MISALEEFSKKHAKVIDLCQRIEYELKYINHYLLVIDGIGSNDSEILCLKDSTLRPLVSRLAKCLDEPLLENNDLYYDVNCLVASLFPRIKERNFWAHNSFNDLKFAKNDDELIDSSKVYFNVCERLERSYKDFGIIVEKSIKLRTKIEMIACSLGMKKLDKKIYTKTDLRK